MSTLFRWVGWALVAAISVSAAVALIAWWETGPRDPREVLEGVAKLSLFNLIVFAVLGGVIAALTAAYSRWVEQPGRVHLARWIQQWSYGAAVAMLGGAIFHLAGRPISWWTDGYTLSGTAFLVVACLGAIWATGDYLWRLRR